MRKFNLKGTVIQRMRGIEREEPRTVENVKTQIEETPVMSVDFTEEQGVFACAWRTGPRATAAAGSSARR